MCTENCLKHITRALERKRITYINTDIGQGLAPYRVAHPSPISWKGSTKVCGDFVEGIKRVMVSIVLLFCVPIIISSWYLAALK